MTTQDDPPTKSAELPLTAFELPKWLVEPAVRSCRLFNTALDFIFYNVPTLRAALAEKDAPMQARGEKPPSRIIDFDALSDPEGVTAPHRRKHRTLCPQISEREEIPRVALSGNPGRRHCLDHLRRQLGAGKRGLGLGHLSRAQKNGGWQSCQGMGSLTSSCRDSAAGSPSVCMISSVARR